MQWVTELRKSQTIWPCEFQRELRMETQMRDLCAQIQTLNATLQKAKPTVNILGVLLITYSEIRKPHLTVRGTQPQNPSDAYLNPWFRLLLLNYQHSHRTLPQACAMG